MSLLICNGCGTPNNIPELSRNDAPKCGRCGRYLTAVDAIIERSVNSGASDQVSLASQAWPRPRGAVVWSNGNAGDGLARKLSSLEKKAYATPGWHRAFFILFGLIVSVAVFASLTSNSFDQRTGTSTRMAAAPQAVQPSVVLPSSSVQPTVTLPPAIAQQAGLMRNYSGRQPVAPLRIETSPGADYYVKLVDVVTGRDVVTIYAQGGRPVEVNVPLGRYEMRYASGEVWRGEAHLFGPDNMTSYAKAESIFEFTQDLSGYSGYTVELIRQVGGNLDTRSIDSGAF